MKDSAKKTFNLPFAEVEAAAIKKAIAGKFGSVSQFSRLTNRDLGELNVRLRGKTPASVVYLEKVFADAKQLCNQPANGYHLTPIQREKLRAALGGFETVVAFCSQNNQFSSVFISRVLHGGTSKITRKVKELAATLSVTLIEPTAGAPAHV